MDVTRRFVGVAALGAALAGLAVIVSRPVLLVPAAGIGAWLVATQLLFVRWLVQTRAGLEVEQSAARSHVSTGETLPISLTATLDAPSPLAVEVTLELPVGASGTRRADRTARIAPGGRRAEVTATVSLPIAGTFAVGPPTVVLCDPLGLVTQRLTLGPQTTIVVEPPAPREIHVGEGGTAIAATFGEHTAGRHGPGFDPAELRQYVPGDAASRIDWKATARLGHPHTREYEAETDRMTVLLVDHRSVMGSGETGASKLDYARHVALAFVDSARAFADPIVLYTVGDDGLTSRHPQSGSADAYATVRSRLHELQPTVPAGRNGPRGQRPATARRMAADLADDRTVFGTTLHPYFDDTTAYVQRIAKDPLFRVVRSHLGRLRGTVWTVIFTDDTDRVGIREAVKIASRGNGHALVFLTPSVLFEPDGLADAEAAYERYVDFEAFRRELAGLERVSAFEVGPRDRVEAILGSARHRRRVGRRGR